MGNNLIKLVRRKRSNDNVEDKNQHIEPSPIFKLYGHCFDELLKYLSLKDLHSLGQTCKSMQQMTGDFFTRNYSGVKFHCLRNGIYFIDKYKSSYSGRGISIDDCIEIPGFIHLITWIAIENIIYEQRKRFYSRYTYIFRYTGSDIFKYFKLNAGKLKSIKKLSLTDVRLDKQRVDYISKILPKIEVLKLIECDVYGDLHDILLKYCKNLRSIQMNGVKFKNKNKYKWLLQIYEKLEQLSLGTKVTCKQIDELSTFFELNPNIRHFSCDFLQLLGNKDALLNCKVKLDTFEVKDTCRGKCKCAEQRNAWDLLFELHINGFYKRLYINTSWKISYQTNCKPFSFDHDPFSAIHLLQQFCIPTYSNGNVPLLADLIEYTGLLNFPLEKLMNVDRLFLFRQWFSQEEGSLDILSLIQQLTNLREINISQFKSVEILELNVLNREREKLAGAQKVTIYVPDAYFLATKWAAMNGTTNFSMIEMKRSSSYECHKFCECNFKTIFLPPGMF